MGMRIVIDRCTLSEGKVVKAGEFAGDGGAMIKFEGSTNVRASLESGFVRLKSKVTNLTELPMLEPVSIEADLLSVSADGKLVLGMVTVKPVIKK